jgi:hypothetical protein
MDKLIAFGHYGMLNFQIAATRNANQSLTGKQKIPQPVNMHFLARTPCRTALLLLILHWTSSSTLDMLLVAPLQ